MADNTAQNATNNIAANEISAVYYQRVKRSLGRAGTASDVASLTRTVSAAAANQDATVIKASPGVLYSIAVTNSNAAARYLKLYDLASGATSASTPKMTLYIPPLGGISHKLQGADFATGIMLRMTTGVADNDANAVAANEIISHIEFV